MPKLILILLERPPLLTDSQLKVLADIGVAAGQLAAASMVLPFVIPDLDRTRIPMITIGIIVMAASWIISVVLVRRIKS